MGLKNEDRPTPTNSPMPACQDRYIEHIGFGKDIQAIKAEIASLLIEIKDINGRQRSLREKLPQEYVNKDELTSISSRLINIDTKLDRWLAGVR